MQSTNRTTLVFLGSCLLFAETALGIIAGMTDANPNLVAGFALAALISVLGTLAFMYWRDPAFLTLSSKEALDLGRFDRLLSMLKEYPALGSVVLEDIDLTDFRPVRSRNVGEADEVGEDEVKEIERRLAALQEKTRQEPEEGG